MLMFFSWQVDVNTEVGVVRDIRLKELRLYTDYGRCSRPLFIVEKQRLLIKKSDVRALQQKEATESGWYDLVSKGFIEYVDTEEEETTMISMTIAVCLVYEWFSSCNNDLPELLATLVHVDSINETVERGKVGVGKGIMVIMYALLVLKCFGV
jgi:DNA-directed RNA polymerase beta subunit